MKKITLIIMLLNISVVNAQWIQQTNLSEPMLLFIDLYPFDSDNVIAVGQFLKAFKTTDGGNSWVNYGPAGSTDWFEKIDFTDSITGYACTLTGSIYKTINGGLSWNQIGTGFNPLYSIAFINPTTGYAVGIGNLLKTTNAGVSWNYVSSVSPQPMNQISFVNSSIGFIVGNGGYIYKTTNGGLNWSQQTSNTTNFLNSVFFASPNTGWVVGTNGLVLNTKNGGANWNVQNSNTTQELIGFYAIDTNIAYAVGASGTILYTSDGGLNWSHQQSNTTSNLLEVKFVGNDVGYIIGNNGTILKTTNAGLGLNENSINKQINVCPNPFNMQTTLQFDKVLKRATLTLYNSLGQQVRQVNNISGQTITIHRDNLSSGLYYLQLTQDNQTIATDKLVITD